jgi:hypothetical protein
MNCNLCAEFKNLNGRQLILWERPKATGAVIATIVAVLMLFGYFEYTLITFLCRALQLALVTVGVLVYQKWIVLSVDDVKKMTRTVISDTEPFVITAVEQLHRVVTWEEPMLSLRVFVVSLVLAFLGNVLSDLTLLLVATVFVFGVPVAYTKNKSVIDPYLSKANKLVDEQVNKLKPKTA